MQYNGNYPLCSANPIGRAGPMGLSDSSINNEEPLYGDGNQIRPGQEREGLGLTTKDPFTGTETIFALAVFLKAFIINNEGPLYGDGNVNVNSVTFLAIINNEGPLYGDGNTPPVYTR